MTVHCNDMPLVMLGAGGHAKVLLALAKACGRVVAGVCDPQLLEAGLHAWRGVPVLGGDEALDGFDPIVYGLINGVGQAPKQSIRRRLYDTYREKGFAFPVLIHPFSYVAEDVQLSDGVQIMAGAVLQSDCTIGANTTINTRASIDHDCSLGANVHIAPGATLCGGVSVADNAYIGAGATVIQGISVGSGAIVGAGVACVRNIKSGDVIIGAAVRRNNFQS